MTVTSPATLRSPCWQGRCAVAKIIQTSHPGSRDCLPCYADPVRTVGSKSKAPASEDSEASA